MQHISCHFIAFHKASWTGIGDMAHFLVAAKALGSKNDELLLTRAVEVSSLKL